jgi:hypothetical protein
MRNAAAALVIIAFVLFFISPNAEAQEAQSFEQLKVLVKPGDRIYVTDSTGTVTKGRITALSTSTLTLLANKNSRELSEKDISRIRQWRHDSLKNGALIGMGVGVGLGALGTAAFCGDSWYDCNAGEVIGLVAVYAGIGTAIGVGIDALIPSKQTIYVGGARTALNRIKVKPILDRSHKGVAMAFSF